MISEATEGERNENKESVARVDLIRKGGLAFFVFKLEGVF